MVYRNRTYVAFDGDNDIRFYRMMNMWKQSNNSSFTFSDAHDINNARDTSSEETIKEDYESEWQIQKCLFYWWGIKLNIFINLFDGKSKWLSN
ncbi:hypothetical protein P7H30_04345 [Streptococcus parauberis]|nr:hypothetical protein [Streptococcus parauberis]MDT2748977.1 hypothetical protein [Streptococcus parauberis]